MAADPKARHMAPVPGSVYWLLDAGLLALAGVAATALLGIPWVAGLAGGPAVAAGTEGLRWAWTLAHAAVLPILFQVLGQYRFLYEPGREWSFPRVLLSVTFLDVGLLAFLRVLGWPATGQAFVLAAFAATLLAACAWRAVAQRRMRRLTETGKRRRNVLLMGTSPLMGDIALLAVANRRLGRRIVGFVGEGPIPPAPTEAWSTTADDPVRAAMVENSLRNPDHLWVRYVADTDDERRRLLDGLNVEEVYLGPRRSHEEVAAWLRVCQERGLDTHIVPDHHVELAITPSPWQLGPYVMLDVHRRPISLLGWWMKRGMDIAGAAAGLVLASPIILATAVAIKIETPAAPVFYPGRRVGLKGRIFRMAKFTTMRPDAQRLEESLQAENQREGPWFKLESDKDPRLTRVGRFIRKYSINEIPQFWNVLKGDMSLVGPRPPIPEEVATYLDYDVRYFRCLDAKPGITGLWQVTAKNDPSFDRRIELDLAYMRDWSVWLDLKIMLKTVVTVVKEKEE